MGPTEHEAKLPVADFQPVREALDAAGAARRDRAEQVDALYDLPDRRLTGQDAALRLRRSERGATLTYKGPPEAAAFKLRVEHETAVVDPDATARLLTALGYVLVLRYTKMRETWDFRACTVCLDRVAGLGDFVEVEGPDAATIEGVLRALELDPGHHVDQSYPQLLAARCAERGWDPTALHERPLP